MTDLVGRVHDALNATAVPRRPDPTLLPPLAPAVHYPLPEPTRPTAELVEVLRGRRSSYAFGSRPTLAQVAALLHLGVSSAPRAGGLPSLRTYLVTRGLDGVGAGVHRSEVGHPAPTLTAVRSGDPTAFVAGSLDQPPFASRVPLWVALVADVGVTRERYPPRHYRTLHLDAGAALQNLLLVATALALPVCPVMGFDDAAWVQLLNLEDSSFVLSLIHI